MVITLLWGRIHIKLEYTSIILIEYIILIENGTCTVMRTSLLKDGLLKLNLKGITSEEWGITSTKSYGQYNVYCVQGIYAGQYDCAGMNNVTGFEGRERLDFKSFKC